MDWSSADERVAASCGDRHEGSIEATAAAGIAQGCNPPADDRYRPTDLVRCDQMASFFRRAEGHSPVTLIRVPAVLVWR